MDSHFRGNDNMFEILRFAQDDEVGYSTSAAAIDIIDLL